MKKLSKKNFQKMNKNMEDIGFLMSWSIKNTDNILKKQQSH